MAIPTLTIDKITWSTESTYSSDPPSHFDNVKPYRYLCGHERLVSLRSVTHYSVKQRREEVFSGRDVCTMLIDLPEPVPEVAEVPK